MKKLICAAMVAASMCAMAEEVAKPAAVEAKAGAAAEAKAEAPVAKRAAKVGPRRSQMTPEQRAKMREQRQQFMQNRRAMMEAKQLEIVKKYVSDEEKAKELVKELQDAMMAGRRDMMRPPRPTAEQPAEAK